MNVLCIMHSKSKWMHISMQHHSDPRHTFRVDCLGCLPVLCKVSSQQGHTSSQQCTNPLLIISRILHNNRYCNYNSAKVEMPAVALHYPMKSSGIGFWTMSLGKKACSECLIFRPSNVGTNLSLRPDNLTSQIHTTNI